MFSLLRASPILKTRLRACLTRMASKNKAPLPSRLFSSLNPLPGSDAYPIIPRIRTVLPHPVQLPHPGMVQLIRDTEVWTRSIANRSILDDQTRAYIHNLNSVLFWDTPCLYTSFAVNPCASYKTLFELNKQVTLAQFVDEMVEHEQQSLITGELFEYMQLFQKNPDFVHDPANDNKRNFWVNMLGHAVNGLREGGLTRNLIRREIHAFEKYTKIAGSAGADRPQDLDWTNYWNTRVRNAYVEVVAIPVEGGAGVDLPDELFNDPDIWIVINSSYKLNIIVNDLVSYFREVGTEEFSFNFIPFIQKQMGISVQEAVDRTAEHVIIIHNQLVSSARAALQSPICRKFPQLDPFIKYVVPRYTYGGMTSYEMINRNYMNRHRPDYNQRLKSGRWGSDDLFLNESDPNKGGEKLDRYYDQYLEKIKLLHNDIQGYV